MTIIDKLLLDEGGGVFTPDQLAIPADNTASVLIGIGGTGIDCLRAIKTRVKSRLRPDFLKSGEPSFQHIRFLGIDSEKPVEPDKDDGHDGLCALTGDEYFCLSLDDAEKLPDSPEAISGKRELAWLRYKDIDFSTFKTGSGGIRQVGRFMMMQRSFDLMNAIDEAIKAVKTGLSRPAVEIHIFAGLCGGTGSGCLLDVCYFVQHNIRLNGDADVFGYFFTPDICLAKAPDISVMRQLILRNGYAAMQELNYCMQFPFNGGSFTQEYQNGNYVDWKVPPVNMCHLIGLPAGHESREKGIYDRAAAATAEYVMTFLCGSKNKNRQRSTFSEQGTAADGAKEFGEPLSYCVIGSACAQYPRREINTCLAAGLMARFESAPRKDPTNEDVGNLVISTLSPGAPDLAAVCDKLLKEILPDKCALLKEFPGDFRTVHDKGNAVVVDYYSDQRKRINDDTDDRARKLASAFEEDSLYSRLDKNLLDLCRDPEKGPSFVMKILDKKWPGNLFDALDAILDTARKLHDKTGEKSKKLEAEYLAIDREFDSHPRKMKYDEYLKAISAFVASDIRLTAIEKLISCIDRLYDCVRQRAEKCYSVIADLYSSLNGTFALNRKTFENGYRPVEDIYNVNIITLKDLMPEIKRVIAETDVKTAFAKLIDCLCGCLDQTGRAKDNVAAKFSGYIVNDIFSDFAGRSLQQLLINKYDIADEGTFAEKISRELLLALAKKTELYVSLNSAIWNSDSNMGKYAVMGVPFTDSAEVVMPAGRDALAQAGAGENPFRANGSEKISADQLFGKAVQQLRNIDPLWNTNFCYQQDCIYSLRVCTALPLFALAGTRECEEAYYADTFTGIHIYEGFYDEAANPGMTVRDWNALAPITPEAYIDGASAPQRLKNQISDASAVYDEAVKLGFVDNEGAICTYSEDVIANLRNLIGDCREAAEHIVTVADALSAEQLLERLNADADVPLVKTNCYLPNDGYKGSEEVIARVHKDYFIAAPAYQIMIRDSVNCVSSLRSEALSTADLLRAAINAVKDSAILFDTFADALFAGSFDIDDETVSYSCVVSGKNKKYILSRRGDAYGMIPVWQAYLGYRALDKEIRDQLKEKEDSIYNDQTEVLRRAESSVRKLLNEDNFNDWLNYASVLRDSETVTAFINNLQIKFESHCANFLS